jgi:LmbE family N-acetylglucosaminyl deacetylase
MHRRELFGHAFAAGFGWGARPGFAAQSAAATPEETPDVVIERDQPGKPHAGKVLAAIQPHSDDLPIFAAGVIFKLLNEGYTGYLIRTSNDEAAGPGTIGECIEANERDNFEVTRIFGLKKAYDLYCRNHRMDGEEVLDLRARLIFLFRLLKVDTIVCYDPWGHYEENPDHYVTAACVEAACWMAGGSKDYPEHFDAGLKPHSVQEKYYFARGPQLLNRVVDIGSYVERKIDVMIANKAQGPAGQRGSQLRQSLAARNLRLPILGDDDGTANREYIRHFLMKREEETGRKYGLQYAEPYHYIGLSTFNQELEDYIRRNSVPLG